jgi:ABC-2 type transport system ATP-binding protein
MSGPRHAISARSLTKRYGSTTALDGLDLDVAAGVVYGFLGPNGAGKTTTMRLFTGLTEPTDGSATVAGVDCTDRAALVEHIGLLPETPPLYDELTGREQLRFAADVRGLDWEQVSDRSLSLCDDLDLTADLDARIDGYSKGMAQKTAFVQAVQHDPDVLFLDEPTSGLDPRAAKTLRDVIADLAADHTTVFLSTHILSVVEAIADRVGVLHDGRLVAAGSPADLIERLDGDASDGDADLEDAFLELTAERGEPP